MEWEGDSNKRFAVEGKGTLYILYETSRGVEEIPECK